MKTNNISFINRIPEFSDRNFTLAGYVCGVLVAASACFFIYEMFTTQDFGYTVQWNIFRSRWFTPLYWVGVIVAILNWGKFGSWSYKTVNVYEDRYGNKRKEESGDLSDLVFGSILMPFLGHFVIEPILYACIIYYPMMCVFSILGKILPFVIAVVLVGISAGVFLCGRYAGSVRCHSLVLVLFTVIVCGGLTWVSVNLYNSHSSATVEQPGPDGQPKPVVTDEGAETGKSADDDDMFSDVPGSPGTSGTSDDDMFGDN